MEAIVLMESALRAVWLDLFPPRGHLSALHAQQDHIHQVLGVLSALYVQQDHISILKDKQLVHNVLQVLMQLVLVKQAV